MFAAFVERGIVSRRDIIAAVFEGELEHRAELYLSVADDAGFGVAPRRYSAAK